MSWILSLIFTAISEVLIEAVNYLAGYINNIFNTMYELNLSLKLDQVSSYTLYVGITLTSMFAVKQGIDVYVLHTNGDSEEDPLELVTRIAITVATIVCGQWVIQYLIKLASSLGTEITSRVVYEKREFGDIFLDMMLKVVAAGTILCFVQLIFIVIVVIAFMIFILKAARRGAELILFQVMLPIVALDLLTTNREKWNAFKTELLICVFGYIIQLFCFNVFMVLFSKVLTIDVLDPKYLFGSIAWLMIVLSAPKWLQKFMYSTGIGNAAKSGVRSAVYIAPKLLK